MASVRTDVAAGNLQQADFTAHTLKGVAANISLTGVADAAAALEQALKQKKRRCLEKLAAALTQVLAGLETLSPVSPLAAIGPLDRSLLERQLSELAELG